MNGLGERDNLIVVLSRNYSTGLSVVRSLGAAGYTVDLLASAYKPGVSKVAAASKYIHRATEVVSPKVTDGKDELFLAELMKYADKERKTILFPTDDYTTSIVDANRDVLEPYFLFPHIEGGSILEHMNKARQGELAEKAGLSVPKEWVVSLQSPTIPEDLTYPCFVKPLDSLSGYKTEMGVCLNKTELERMLAHLREQDVNRNMLVQEYLSIDAELDFSALCADEEVFIPALIQKDRIAAYEQGVTMAGTLVPVDTIGEMATQVMEMLRAYHYVGMVDVELHRANGKWYFGEVNLRSGGPNYAYFKSGVNLPAFTVRALLGEPLPEQVTARTGATFVNEKVAWEDLAHNKLSLLELQDLWKKKDFGLLNEEDDPEPYRLFLQSLPVLVARGKARVLLDGRKKAPAITAWVVGRNYDSNLGMARSLAEAGYRVKVLHVFDTNAKGALKQWLVLPHADACSNKVSKYMLCLTKGEPDNLYRKLKQLCAEERQLLIPTDDFVAGVIDAHYNELKNDFYLPNVADSEGGINRLMDKAFQKELASSFGVAVVKGNIVDIQNGSYTLPDTISYPCFIKPNISKDAPKSIMTVCNTESDLRTALSSLGQNVSVLVEDYLTVRKEYAYLGVSVNGKTILPALFQSDQMGEGSRRGVALTGTTLPPDALPWKDALTRMVSSLQYTGLFDIDLIEDTEGNLYFTELNLRCGGSVSAFTESGLNLPALYADALTRGNPLEEKENPHTGRTFVSERGLLELYAKGALSLRDVRKVAKQASIHFIKDEKDPWPYRQWKAGFLPAFLLRLHSKL